MHDGYNVGNAAEPKKKESYLEIRLAGFRESNNRLDSLRERLERLEIKLSGQMYSEQKISEGELPDKKMSCQSDVVKPSIMEEFNSVNNDTNTILDRLKDSITHLEELI